MPFYRSRKPWEESGARVTPQQSYLNRRRLLAYLGLGTLGGVGIALEYHRRMVRPLIAHDHWPSPSGAAQGALVATPNPRYAAADRALTDERFALAYNNFYEFSTEKEEVAALARDFRIDPYGLIVDGLVERPGTLSLERIEQLGVEERVYRHRCVEAWAMTVPWSGVPLASLLALVGVKREATHVAFTSFKDPAHAPGQRNTYFKWPYYEGLRVDEAMNELALIATGLYGKRLSPQNGAPLRIVLPWKYGYKGPKSVVRMTLLDHQPPTFWNDAASDEYDFIANVDPTKPHPRWSQASERLLGSGERVTTRPYNGYGDQVARLYQ